MTVKQLYNYLNDKIPASLSCEWDNDGLMCCPCPDKVLSRVLVCLDATAEAIEAARSGKYELIVTHHPLIFKGVCRIDGEDFLSRKLISLIKSDIAVFSFHTRLDALEGGVNDTLCGLLGLCEVQPFADGIGRIGTLDKKTDVATLAKKLKAMLDADGVLVADAKIPCHRIAVLGGGGDGEIALAREAGADTYISGDFSYHSKTDAPDMGINLIEAGHFYTENPVCTVLRDLVLSADSTLVCDIFYSNRTKFI